MEISITRALSEYKILKERIEFKILKLSPFVVTVGAKIQERKFQSMDLAAFTKQTQEEVDSVKGLMKRAEAIKKAIDESNFVTKVKIAGEEMTVLEALNKKKSIPLKKSLLRRLESEFMDAGVDLNTCLKRNEERITTMVENEIKSSAAGSKVSKSEEENILKKNTEMVEKTYPVVLQDPCKAQDWIKSLQKEVEDFEHEVDYVLSESNSTTLISIPD